MQRCDFAQPHPTKEKQNAPKEEARQKDDQDQEVRGQEEEGQEVGNSSASVIRVRRLASLIDALDALSPHDPCSGGRPVAGMSDLSHSIAAG